MKHLTNAFNGLNHWWRYLLLIIISLLGGQTVGLIPLGVVIVVKIIQSGGVIAPNPDNLGDLTVYGINDNLLLALLLFSTIVSLIVLFLLVKPFHKRNYKSLFSGGSRIRWKRFFTAAIVWALLMTIYLIVDYNMDPGNFAFNFDLYSFIVLIIVSLLFFPFQASYEELLFRGYMAQGIAVWTKNRILVIVIPAVIFGLVHSVNPEVKEFGFLLAMPQYILVGLILGLISVLDDGIELAMGVHTANNIFLSLFLTHKASALQTNALLTQENVDPVKDILVALFIGIIFVTIISKLYKFDYRVLTKKIVNPHTEE